MISFVSVIYQWRDMIHACIAFGGEYYFKEKDSR